MLFKYFIYLLSFVETPRKFINLILINLRGVSTKLNKYIEFTMQTYKKLSIWFIFDDHSARARGGQQMQFAQSQI